jgi:hypothetical protein
MFSRLKSHAALAVALTCLLVSAAWGDSLQLSNGSLIKGKYLGGTDTEIKFQVGSTVQQYPVWEVVSISFESASRPAVSNLTPQLAPKPAPAATAPVVVNQAPQLAPRPVQAATIPSTTTLPAANYVTVPSGTRIAVRTIDAIDSDRNKIGDKFQASLEVPIVVDGATVVPKGADVYGRLIEAKQAGSIQGRSELRLELTGLVVNGQAVPLVTGDYSVSGGSRGAQTAKRVGAGTAVGAVIGAIAGGGKGAAIGAGVGAGAGTAVQVMTKGEQVHVPSETLLDFALEQDTRVPVRN